MVVLEVGEPGSRRAGEAQPLWGDAAGREEVTDPFLGRATGPGAEQEAGAGNSRQPTRPDGQDLIRDLGRVVQATEGDLAGLPGRRLGADLPARGRVRSRRAFWQANERLLVVRLDRPGGSA